MPKFSTKFDSIYKKHAPDVPVAFLQALAAYESSNKPRDRSGIAWGLLQVSKKALTGYNKQKGTNFKLVDVLDPVLNVKVFYQQWRMFGRVFQRIVRHKGIALASNFVEDWSNRQYALLVTMAWNSGIGAVASGVKWSRPRALEPLRMKPLTATDIGKAGRRDGSSKVKKSLSLKKLGWQAKVVGSYFGLLEATKEGLRVPTEVTYGGMRGGTLLILALLWYATTQKRGRG